MEFESDDNLLHTLIIDSIDLDEIKNWTVQAILKAKDDKIINSEWVEIYLDGTNACVFFQDLDANKETLDDSKILHLFLGELMDYFEDSNQFNHEIEIMLVKSLNHLKSNLNINLPFKFILRADLGNEKLLD